MKFQRFVYLFQSVKLPTTKYPVDINQKNFIRPKSVHQEVLWANSKFLALAMLVPKILSLPSETP